MNEPTLLLTVASVSAVATAAEPSTEPEPVASPVKLRARAVVHFGALTAVRTGVVVGLATVMSPDDDETLVTLPEPVP